MSVFKVIENRDLKSKDCLIVDLYNKPNTDDLIFIDFKSILKVREIIWIPEIVIDFSNDPIEGDQIYPSDDTEEQDLEKIEGFIMGEILHVDGVMNDIVKKIQ